MKRKLCSAFLTCILLIGLLPVFSDALGTIPAKETQSNGQPYYIMVNRRMSTVTVYGLDENNCYTVPVRAMICSTGSAEHATPRGNYAVGRKHRWRQMMGGVYAQYLSQFHNECLFHSVCYSRPRSDALLTGYYEALGAPASHGCIRLQTEDAKWIYENCDAGTKVTVYDSAEAGELGKPEKMIPTLRKLGSKGWDPTDPEPGNPWADHWTTAITLSENSIALTPGETFPLNVTRLPEGTTYPTTMFRSEDASVAVVDGSGQIRATGPGRTTITVSCGEAEQVCEIIVSDTLLPYRDIVPDDWFYADVEYLIEIGLLDASKAKSFTLESPIPLGEALDLLRRYAESPACALSSEQYERWADHEWYAAGGAPASPMSRREVLSLLYRFDELRAGEAADWPVYMAFSPVDEDPVTAWALRTGLLRGDDEGMLSLDEDITRAQMAALIHRFCEI